MERNEMNRQNWIKGMKINGEVIDDDIAIASFWESIYDEKIKLVVYSLVFETMLSYRPNIHVHYKYCNDSSRMCKMSKRDFLSSFKLVETK
jgi:hypothetical protein